MEAKQLVTVIIPTFNREKKLPDAIESAINQSYPNTQIIVVDDGSTDKTKDLLLKYPQVEYFYQPNGGQASARNKGLKNAKGTIIASLDSDDIWMPDFLTKCVTKLEKDNLDLVFANWEQEAKIGKSWDFLNNDPYLKPYFIKEKDKWVDLNYDEVRHLFVRACPSPSSSVVMRKSSIISGWDEKINIGDDWSMYLEMILSKPFKVAFTLEKLWKKRIDEINIYDGRKWSEILEFLHIADLKRNIDKFGTLLTVTELQVLQERYMASLVELSKHNLIREWNIVKSIQLLRTSLKINTAFTLRAIPNIFLTGLQRKIDYFKKK